MRHFVYTRQAYDDDELFELRMELATRTCIPSMIEAAEQASHPVGWVWWGYPRHQEEVYRVVREAGWQGPLMVGPGDTWTEGEDIQTTLDSDDQVGPDFLELVQELHEPGETYLVTWQPVKLELATGKRYRSRMRYSAGTPSMFYSVYNPSRKARVYAATHTRMSELCPAMLHPQGGLCYAVIHDDNALMQIHPEEREL